MIRKIYLMRHTAVIKPKEKKFIGQTDLMLNSRGIFQAMRLADYFSEIPLAGIYCSSLKRSVDTAEIISRGSKVPLEIIKDFDEINLGSWEGRSFQEIREKYPLEYLKREMDIYNYRIHGGESYADLEERSFGAFKALLENTRGNLLIVGHQGVNRVIISRLLGTDSEDMKPGLLMEMKYGGITVIEKYENSFSVSKNILIA